MESFKNASGMIQKEYGQNPIGTVFNLISLLNTNRQKPANFCLFLIPPVTTTFKNRFRLQDQPHLLFPVGLPVEAEQKFLACRELRYEQKSIVWAKRVMDFCKWS